MCSLLSDFLKTYLPLALSIEFARSRIERDAHLFAGFVASSGNRFEHDLNRFFIGLAARRKSAFVADGSVVAALLQRRFQRVKNLHAPAQSFRKSRRSDRHDHEFLKVHGTVGVRTAIENVHHRDRQQIRAAVA